jgi:hypothetical protein
LSWLYICSAIVKYTEKLVKDNVDLNTCRNISLETVVKDVYSYKLSSYLCNYIRARQLNRIEDERRGDNVGSTEIHNELKERSMYADIN